jgi:GH25 family lysozyme M1 (1,4-beta-N-acetylmuramidase)
MDLAHAHDFLDILNHRLGRRAVLYSGETVKSSLGDRKDAFFGHHRLWLAQYGPTPQVQASWKRYWLWQYTNGSDGPGPKTVPGISGDANGELDCDHYAGSEAALRQEWAA